MPASSETADLIATRKDDMLAALISSVPYAGFLGVRMERYGNEVTGILDYDPKLIGPADPPRLHGGATAGFLEVVAIIHLAWRNLRKNMNDDDFLNSSIDFSKAPVLPKTIGLNINHLHAGTPRRAFARANVLRIGERRATVQVEAWQESRDAPFSVATFNFLLPYKPTPLA